MTDSTDQPIDPREERELRDAVRGLPRVEPESAYRLRVKQAFLSAPAPAVTPIRPGRPAIIWGSAVALAALIAVALLITLRAPVWTVHERLSGGLLVDGAPADFTESLALQSGVRISNPGPGIACIEVRGAISMILAADTEITLGSKFGFPRPSMLTAEIHRGQLLARTGTKFPSGGLSLASGDVDLRILGTTFGVFSDADSTCVCVFDGTVEAITNSGTAHPIPPGERYSRYTSERKSMTWPLEPVSAAEVQMLRLLQSPQIRASLGR